MKKRNPPLGYKVLFLVSVLWFLVTFDCPADTVTKNDGGELKGIVVEDYKDRITFSTADGEITVMKADIKELFFDSDEDNLLALAEQAKDKADYETAYAYYDKALKASPDSKKAKNGVILVQGLLFKQEEARKEESVAMREAIERYGSAGAMTATADDAFNEARGRLWQTFGMVLNLKGSAIEVGNIDKGSPAEDAGLRKGDLLVAIWQRLTGYMSLKEAVNLILKKASYEVKCTFERTISIPITNERPLLAGTDVLIGASFAMEFDGLTVSTVTEDGPADGAGLHKGDLITAIDGRSTRYMPLKKAIEMIRNSNDGKVGLTLRREVTIWGKGSAP